MKNLVEQLLFLARGINWKTQLNQKEFLLNDMINEVLEESKMIDKNHKYSYINSENIYVYGDTSLGLSIAKWIVDSHKGYFSALSRKDIGTRITVFLPQK